MWPRMAASAAAPSRPSIARTIARARPSRGAAALGSERGGGDERHRAVHHLELLDQVAVVAREVDLAVEALVGAGEALGLADEGAVLLDHLPEDGDFLGRGVLGGEARGEALELGADDVELAELVVVEARDHEAAAVAGDDALRLQPLERLADRGARDAEADGELGLRPAGRPDGTRRGRSLRARAGRRPSAAVRAPSVSSASPRTLRPAAAKGERVAGGRLAFGADCRGSAGAVEGAHAAHRFRPRRDLGLRPRQHPLPRRGPALRPDRAAHDGLRHADARRRAGGGQPPATRLLGEARHDARRAHARARDRPRALPRGRPRHRPDRRSAVGGAARGDRSAAGTARSSTPTARASTRGG